MRSRSLLSSGASPHVLLAVLTATTIVVATSAVIAYTIFFPARFRGWAEVAPDGRIAGWAIDQRDTSRRVEVQLYIDGNFITARTADLPRPDVVAAGWTKDEMCGYSFTIEGLPSGRHEARIFATHTVAGGRYMTLQMTGLPVIFTSDEAGRAHAAKP